MRLLVAALLTLLLPALASAQGLADDYRLEGEDSKGDAYLAEVSLEWSQGQWLVSRTYTYVDDEDRFAHPETWVASHVEQLDPRKLRVTYGGPSAQGFVAALGAAQEVDSSDDLKEPVTGYYYLSADGERLTEWLTTDKPVGGKKGWRWALARGARDHPTLVLEAEEKFDVLFEGLLNRYEASGVTLAEGELLVVFDNAPDLGAVDLDLIPEASELYDGDGKGASDFEGVSYDPLEQRYYVIVEAEKHGNHLEPRLWQLRSDLSPRRKVWLPYEPAGRGKGFEGLLHMRRDGEEYLLALLEGNHGESDERSLDRGHGKIVVFERKSSKRWRVDATIDLPETAAFSDYSGLDLKGDRLAVVSQTSSLLWVGRLSPDAWSLEGEGQVFRFPREGSVAIYASVEGVAWLSDGRVAVVSDRYQGKHEPCKAKDQSVHLFSFPD